jgi:hypothetical protein
MDQKTLRKQETKMKKFRNTPNYILDREYEGYMLLGEIEPINKNTVRFAIHIPDAVVENNKFFRTSYYDTIAEADAAAKGVIDNGMIDEIRELPF